MLLDLRVVLAAVLATVLLLTAGFSLIAGVRSPLKTSLGFSIGGPPEARALNAPQSQPTAPQKSLQVRNRPADILPPAVEKPARVPEAVSAINTANLAIHEQSTLIDADKAAKSATPGGPHAKQLAKAKKKIRPATTPPQASKSAPFSFGQ